MARKSFLPGAALLGALLLSSMAHAQSDAAAEKVPPVLGSQQTQEPCPPDNPCGGIPRFAEYGNIRFRDERAVLDSLAVQFSKTSESIAYFLVYAGHKACVNEAVNRATRAKTYLVKKHSIGPDRVIWKDAGHLVDLSTQIWLLPKTSKLPEPFPQLDRKHVQLIKKCQTSVWSPR